MPKFTVTLSQTVYETATVVVEAADADAAGDVALSDRIPKQWHFDDVADDGAEIIGITRINLSY